MEKAQQQVELFKVFVAEDAAARVKEVLQSGTLTQGPQVEAFERELGEALGTTPQRVVTVNSATAGLQLGLRILKKPFGTWPGIAEDDRVLTPALTCWAATCSILNEGLRPLWIDADPQTGRASLTDIAAKLSPKTKVVEVMHWGGSPVDVQALDILLEEASSFLGFKPLVIEDCAHAFGARYPDGRLVGTSGNICVFSFQAIKVLTCGDGGAIVFPEGKHGADLTQRGRLLRWFGIDRDGRRVPRVDGTDYRLEADVPEHGGKLHMNDYNAALGRANLPEAPRLVQMARKNARRLYEGTASLKHVRPLLSWQEVQTSSCWLFSVRVSDKEEFLRYGGLALVTVSQVHKRNDLHSCVADCRPETPLVGIEDLDKHLVCLPCGWWLTEENLDRILRLCVEYEESQTHRTSTLPELPATLQPL